MLQRMPIVLGVIGALMSPARLALAEDSRPTHEGAWPIQHGVRHQPTRSEGGEFSKSQQDETDRLYNELMSNYGDTHHTGNARVR
jgi:hypothetical protein